MGTEWVAWLVPCHRGGARLVPRAARRHRPERGGESVPLCLASGLPMRPVQGSPSRSAPCRPPAPPRRAGLVLRSPSGGATRFPPSPSPPPKSASPSPSSHNGALRPVLPGGLSHGPCESGGSRGSPAALLSRSVPPRRRSGAPAPPASPLLPAASPDLLALLSCLTVTMFCFAPKVFSRPLVSAQALPRFCAFSRAAPLLPVVILKRQFFRNQPACPSPQCTHRVGPRRTPRLLRTPVTSVLCFRQVARPIGTKA